MRRIKKASRHGVVKITLMEDENLTFNNPQEKEVPNQFIPPAPPTLGPNWNFCEMKRNFS